MLVFSFMKKSYAIIFFSAIYAIKSCTKQQIKPIKYKYPHACTKWELKVFSEYHALNF